MDTKRGNPDDSAADRMAGLGDLDALNAWIHCSQVDEAALCHHVLHFDSGPFELETIAREDIYEAIVAWS
jgi:hypothetical protein